MALCIVCHVRPVAVPDRERSGRPIKRVCRECHAKRLRLDLRNLLKKHDELHKLLKTAKKPS